MEIMENTYKITGGIYLVLDPAMDKATLLNKLASALTAGIQAVQLWNHWQPDADKLRLIESIGPLCRLHGVPLFINDDWELLKQAPALQGVHFDSIPADFEAIKAAVGRPFMAGITCSDNLDRVIWAEANRLDYVSFCSMFPSSSAGSCDIVMPATVRQARELTPIPIFVAGGITPQNIIYLKQETPFDGIAVISGILSAVDPQQKVKEFKNALSIHPIQHATQNN
jgi:thiamine-phosphate pyrophosphorylase